MSPPCFKNVAVAPHAYFPHPGHTGSSAGHCSSPPRTLPTRPSTPAALNHCGPWTHTVFLRLSCLYTSFFFFVWTAFLLKSFSLRTILLIPENSLLLSCHFLCTRPLVFPSFSIISLLCSPRTWCVRLRQCLSLFIIHCSSPKHSRNVCRINLFRKPPLKRRSEKRNTSIYGLGQ